MLAGLEIVNNFLREKWRMVADGDGSGGMSII